MSEIKIGSKVKLLDGGKHHSRESSNAEHLGMTKYNSDVACHGALYGRVGEIFTVVAVGTKISGFPVIGIEDARGEQYIIDPEGVEFVENPEPTLTDRLDLFDRVMVSGFKFIVVTDHDGNKVLLGDNAGWVSPEDVAKNVAIEIYGRPIYTVDVFDFNMIGKLKYQSPKSLKKQELTEKIITLQEQLTAAGEELAALN